MKTRNFVAAMAAMMLVGSTQANPTQSFELQSKITNVQPMTGLVLWNYLAEDEKKDYGQCFGLEFTYCLPCDIVKGKNNGVIEYNWTPLEDLLNEVKGRGHQAILRFRYEYPNGDPINEVKGATAVPQYIKDLADYNETYAKNPGGDGPTYYADWSHSELQWFTKQFYTDLAARYGNDPRLAFLEVGFGHWGEYHIYGTKLSLGHNFPSKDYQKGFFEHMDTTMKNLPWLVSVDAADEEYTPVLANEYIMNMNFGLFDDSFMHSEHEKSQGDGYNEECWENMDYKKRFKRGVFGGEISYYTDDDQHNFLNPKGMYGITWEQASAKYHLSFMICNDALDGSYATPQRFKEGSMACGYKFRVTSATTDGTKTVVTVINEGVAPIYKNAYFAIGNTRAEQSLKGLVAGESLTCTIPAGLTQGSDLHIASDYIYPTQTIQYNADIMVSVTTGIENVVESTPVVKQMRQGRLIIVREGKEYNVLGMGLEEK